MADLAAQHLTAMAALATVREARMVDTCRADRPGRTDPTPDLDDNGLPVTDDADPVYEGPCALSDPDSVMGGGGGGATVNDESGAPTIRALQLPPGAPGLRPGDLVTLTGSQYSPGLVGDTFVVLREVERTWASHRRYRIRGSSWASPEAGP